MMSRSCTAHATLTVATAFEFLLITALAAFFICAYPDRSRTALWKIGGRKGWNSDLPARVYYYAKYEGPPSVPIVWDKRFVSVDVDCERNEADVDSPTLDNLCILVLSLALCGIRISICGYTPGCSRQRNDKCRLRHFTFIRERATL
jgi:hypothetical protein